MGPIGDEGRRYRYRPAPLARHQTVVVGPDRLELRDDADRARWQLAWRDVTGAAFVRHTLRGMRMTRLDLMSAAGTRSFACTVAAAGAEADGDDRTFRDAVAAAARWLAEVDPALRVTIGEYGRARLAMFLVGLVSAVFAVALPVAAVATGRGDRLMGEAFVPVALLLLFGGAVVWRSWPWRRRAAVSAAGLAEALGKATDT